MLMPSEDSKPSDLDLQHLIEAEIHSLSTNLGSPIGLGANDSYEKQRYRHDIVVQKGLRAIQHVG